LQINREEIASAYLTKQRVSGTVNHKTALNHTTETATNYLKEKATTGTQDKHNNVMFLDQHIFLRIGRI